ncbi:GNAT family N-acetyltransferase [Paenibacillus sp. GP183]|uniref:GNAT family N-acetyltransferase n=1 Tax=Paenibacillus sp. GP183 TaxID=1882751 RepID=UPI0008956184|nr:GNAT family N-acetyltransferase [Paenibacillus sp. GP183]SEC40732.1 Acetyltransferase (GNAT) domain-containing protein [Paenibacillus sp. GP183]
MGTIIRRMIVDDIPMLQQVAKTTWNKTYEGIIPSHIQEAFLQRNYSETAMKNRMDRSVVFVADIAGKIKGFANFFRSKEHVEEAELGAIYILPEKQSQGIGSQLLNAGIEELSGIKSLFVVVERENTIGKRFYASKGFVTLNEFEEQLDGHTLKSLKMVLKV